MDTSPSSYNPNKDFEHINSTTNSMNSCHGISERMNEIKLTTSTSKNSNKSNSYCPSNSLQKWESFRSFDFSLAPSSNLQMSKSNFMSTSMSGVSGFTDGIFGSEVKSELLHSVIDSVQNNKQCPSNRNASSDDSKEYEQLRNYNSQSNHHLQIQNGNYGPHDVVHINEIDRSIKYPNHDIDVGHNQQLLNNDSINNNNDNNIGQSSNNLRLSCISNWTPSNISYAPMIEDARGHGQDMFDYVQNYVGSRYESTNNINSQDPQIQYINRSATSNLRTSSSMAISVISELDHNNQKLQALHRDFDESQSNINNDSQNLNLNSQNSQNPRLADENNKSQLSQPDQSCSLQTSNSIHAQLETLKKQVNIDMEESLNNEIVTINNSNTVSSNVLSSYEFNQSLEPLEMSGGRHQMNPNNLTYNNDIQILDMDNQIPYSNYENIPQHTCYHHHYNRQKIPKSSKKTSIPNRHTRKSTLSNSSNGSQSSKSNTLRYKVINIDGRTREFACEWPDCHQSFFRKDELRRHIKTVHEKLKPFKCNICDKVFGRKDHLKTHKKTHMKKDLNNKNPPLTCGICGKNFKSAITLKNHKVKIHRIDRNLLSVGNVLKVNA